MNFEYFISRRIRSRDGSSFSRPIVKVSVAGIALGLAVMLISVAILQGFQTQVRDKVSGFGGHIQITGFDSNNSYEPTPIDKNDAKISQLQRLPGILNIQEFGLKAGIIKTEDQIEGVVLKGVNADYDWQFLKDKLTEGSIPEFKDTSAGIDVLISQKLANLLGFKAGDDLRMYFIIDNTARGRKFRVSGIYNTGMAEFDEMYVFGDIRHIRKLNGWDGNLVSGIEINIRDFDHLNEIAGQVYNIIGFKLNTQTIKQLYPQIFDWIEIQDLNVLIILILMALVSGITMISTLLILILEHTRDIGMLKALGATNGSIRKIFIYASVNITFYGLIWGNAVALSLVFLQKKSGFIPLPEDSYFVSVVPVDIGLQAILLINLATVMICTLMMLIPSLVIRYIAPVKAIRYE
ncbi:MAG: ABC transporter permease [Bacteroidales bacterium]|nr:ABC transporter permease [Bacteroidales bacterium]